MNVREKPMRLLHRQDHIVDRGNIGDHISLFNHDFKVAVTSSDQEIAGLVHDQQLGCIDEQAIEADSAPISV